MVAEAEAIAGETKVVLLDYIADGFYPQSVRVLDTMSMGLICVGI